MRLLPRWSFGTKLTLVFLTVTLGPITVISIYYTESWEIVLITGLISIIASLLLGHNISQPISRLTKAAALIKKNHAYDPSDLKDISVGHDEIAHLTHTFNEMVIELRQREEKYRLLFENMPDSFIYYRVVFDKKNKLVNPPRLPTSLLNHLSAPTISSPLFPIETLCSTANLSTTKSIPVMLPKRSLYSPALSTNVDT